MKSAAQWDYPGKDGWGRFSAATDRFWRGTKKVLGNPEWMDTEFLQTALGRAAHIDMIEAGLMDWLSTRTRAQAFEQSQAEHVGKEPRRGRDDQRVAHELPHQAGLSVTRHRPDRRDVEDRHHDADQHRNHQQAGRARQAF